MMGEEAESPGDSKQSSPPSQAEVKPEQPEVTFPTNQSIKAEDGEQENPLGPPPRPCQNQESETSELFAAQAAGGNSLSLEPNPFEQSFSNPSGETSGGGTKLPSVAALTSPQSLIPGQTGSPFNWGGASLRAGPLSPAMLSGPAGDYFSGSHHLRGNFPTPNESSLRTGLTPGGGGTMFPTAPSPGNGQSLFIPNTTPNALEFQNAALSAAAKRGQTQNTQPPATQAVTSQPQNTSASSQEPDVKSAGPFDNHDNDAANGLYMLAQGRGGQAPQQPFPMPAPAQTSSASTAAPLPAATMESQSPAQTSPQTANGSATDTAAQASGEAASGTPKENDKARTSTRGKRKASQPGASTNGRGKVEGGPNKKAKAPTSAAAPSKVEEENVSESDEKLKEDGSGNKKLTDEEKRRNFLERNRVAALKCRQRKKQWLANLQNKVELYSQENDHLTAQITALREEIVNLKTLLLAHKDCPVSQQQGISQAFMPPTSNIDPGFNTVNPQMAPGYPMPGGPMPNSQVMTTQQVDRRFA